jgi:hypothetical protein
VYLIIYVRRISCQFLILKKKNEANEEYSNNLFYKNVYLIFMFDIQSDQQENKSRVLPHRLFYRNLRLSLIVHIQGYSREG